MPRRRGYERAVIDGVNYMVCADCRRPHKPGYRACYLIPQPGDPHPADNSGQSLCRDCYWKQWRRMYPGESLPDIVENTPGWAVPLPWNGLDLDGTPEEIAAQKRAIDMAQLEDLIQRRRLDLKETERMLSELQDSVIYRE